MRPIWKFVLSMSLVHPISACSEQEEVMEEEASEIVDDSADEIAVEDTADLERKSVDADQIGEE